MNYPVQMTPDDMIYIPIFMTICSSIQIILRLLSQQFWSRDSSVGIESGYGLDDEGEREFGSR
jgi:hypothetical protein